MSDNITSCPRCSSFDLIEKNGYLKCGSCNSNISKKEIAKWHFINNQKGEW